MNEQIFAIARLALWVGFLLGVAGIIAPVLVLFLTN